jgi:Alpha/beta hydrolase domain containing 18
MTLYSRWIYRWERKLASKDTNRVVRPFEHGPEWLEEAGAVEPGGFFDYARPKDFRLSAGDLTFTSPSVSPFPENNRVYAAWFPAAKPSGRAVVVLPQWNADRQGHIGLCKLLNRFGISALRLTLAYHDRRRPAELERADYHLSSNIGRTIHASRQSVLDARACLDWLETQGYDRLGILGTSLGSCIAFLAAAHDSRIAAGVFNHVAMHVADVVWTGLSTKHVRLGFGEQVSHEELRKHWAVISPATYLDRMKQRDFPALLVWAKHDPCFLPVYSREAVEQFRVRKLRHEVFTLPCGHYTTGRFPFNLMDGLAMCRFLRRNL